MKKKVLLSIALITAGFLSAPAQNIITMQERLQRPNASFEYPDFEKPQSPSIKKSDSGQGWWEPDTVYCFINLRDIETADNRYVYEYYYHLQKLIVVCKEQRLNNNSWDNFSNYYTYTYDSNYNLLSKLRGINYLDTYTYDSNNNLLTELSQSWRNDSWNNIYSCAYSYDSNNNKLTGLKQNWKNNLWENSVLTTNSYDSSNNLLTGLNQNWVNNSWVNISQVIYTYDSDHNLIIGLNQNWEDNAWVNSDQITRTYDSNHNLLSQLEQKWDNNAWINTYLITCTYDSNHNILTRLEQKWENDAWININQFLTTYDENKNCISSEYLIWKFENWYPSSRSYHPLYYNNFQGVFEGEYCFKVTASYTKVSDMPTAIEPIATPEINDISIYPNPTTGELRIKNYELGIKNYELGIDNVEVFDIYGIKQLSIFNFQFSTQIDISHLPAGIYFVRITTEKGVVTKKIVKR